MKFTFYDILDTEGSRNTVTESRELGLELPLYA